MFPINIPVFNYSLGQDKHGFTLIELMVTIAIIAIISLIGVIVYNNVQQGARDARRREDINAIAAALEVAKDNESGIYSNVPYSVLPTNDFTNDPSGVRYCFSSSSTSTVPAEPSSWKDRATCPAGYSFIPAPNNIGNIASWRVCALLERGASLIFCRNNSQ